MRTFDMIRLLVPELEPHKTKLHLASDRGAHFRLDLFASGGFPEWQRYQTQRNFERPFVFSLIKLAERDRWLFGGVHRVTGPCERRISPENGEEYLHYPLGEIERPWLSVDLRFWPQAALHVPKSTASRLQSEAATPNPGKTGIKVHC